MKYNLLKILTILSEGCEGESSSVNTFVMYPPKPLSTKVLMSLLTVLLALGATFGNGSILAVIARFKSFRTVPNTLLANLAVVDMLNIAINMPIYMISVTLEAGWFRGQSLAIMSSFFNRLFIILNLASLLALMADMYLAMAFDLKYFVWKSTYKAVVSSFIIWFSGTLIVVLFSIPLLLIDLGDVQVIEYRAKIYQQGKYYIAASMALFIICSGILGFLTIQTIKRKKKKVSEMSVGLQKGAVYCKKEKNFCHIGFIVFSHSAPWYLIGRGFFGCFGLPCCITIRHFVTTPFRNSLDT